VTINTLKTIYYEYKQIFLNNICYTELVYGRINKKQNIDFSKKEIEKYILEILKKLTKDFL